ncbi:Protein HPO-5 [Aphelenchoides avenae]|nr:Protein HPO-5 [Aphelenchus avenae]
MASGEEEKEPLRGEPHKVQEEEEKEKPDLERLSYPDLEEVSWRRLSFAAYFTVLVLVGLPIWYFTTTPYRANLPRFSESTSVNVPLLLEIYHTDHFEKDVSRLCNDVKDTTSDHLLPLAANNILVAFKDVVQHRVATMQEALSAIKTSSSNPALRIFVATGGDYQSLKAGEETTVEQSTPSVWEELPIVPKYDVHIIFVHEGVSRDRAAETTIRDSVNRLANFVANTTHLGVSWEHFWSFQLEEFTKKLADETAITDGSRVTPVSMITTDDVSPLITELDKFSSPVGGHDPLIKIAVIFSNDNLVIVDEQGAEANALVVASWGGIVKWNSAKRSESLSGVLRTIETQLGVHRQSASGASNVMDRLAWSRYNLLAFVEHMGQTVHYLNALHSLTGEIGDLVVSDEVSAMAEEAFSLFHQANVQARSNGVANASLAAKARILAERAAKHPTLLQFLNFPSDQKYAIYLPLFAPILVPMLEPLFPAVRSLMRRKKPQ